MDGPIRQHIVISAVNIRKGGTLTVLRECLAFLSTHADRYKVTALVHKRSLCDYPGIDYIEIPWSIKGWGRRLYCEYVTMNKISRSFDGEADLWFSLHDTTPRVLAKRQAVYCHTSFPFMKASWQDLRMDYKIALFSKFTRFAYRINVHRNEYLVVQQQWLRDSLSSLVGYDAKKIIVSPPSFNLPRYPVPEPDGMPVFLYPATPDCHKNFETLCQASRILEEKVGPGKFKTLVTIDGKENRYSSWLYEKYHDVKSVEFHGFMSKDELMSWYGKAACLVFPSRIETWGLPISEYKPTGKPMILSDLPYAHETASGAPKVAFFPPTDAQKLSELMEDILDGNTDGFASIDPFSPEPLTASSWDSLFNLLLSAHR